MTNKDFNNHNKLFGCKKTDWKPKELIETHKNILGPLGHKMATGQLGTNGTLWYPQGLIGTHKDQ
jgi:hypothetical protein